MGALLTPILSGPTLPKALPHAPPGGHRAKGSPPEPQAGQTVAPVPRPGTHVVEVLPLLCPLALREPVVDHLLWP